MKKHKQPAWKLKRHRHKQKLEQNKTKVINNRKLIENEKKYNMVWKEAKTAAFNKVLSNRKIICEMPLPWSDIQFDFCQWLSNFLKNCWKCLKVQFMTEKS